MSKDDYSEHNGLITIINGDDIFNQSLSFNQNQTIVPNITATDQNRIQFSYNLIFQALNIKKLNVLTNVEIENTTLVNLDCPSSYKDFDCLQQNRNISINSSIQSLTFTISYELEDIPCQSTNLLFFNYKVNILSNSFFYNISI
jgi:hypothetical protein